MSFDDALITGGGSDDSLPDFDDSDCDDDVAIFDDFVDDELVLAVAVLISLFLLLTLPLFAVEGDGIFESLLRLKLESLRAEEKPLLELVRFDKCVLLRSLSLLNNLSLSSIECLVVPFCCGCCSDLSTSMAESAALLYGLDGILQLAWNLSER